MVLRGVLTSTNSLSHSLSFCYHSPLLRCLSLSYPLSISFSLTLREECMGRDGALCLCWTLMMVRPLPSPHSVHEHAWYVCPPSAWASCVHLSECVPLSVFVVLTLINSILLFCTSVEMGLLISSVGEAFFFSLLGFQLQATPNLL